MNKKSRMNPLLRCVTNTCLLFAFTSPAFAQDAGDLFARDSYRIDTVVCPFKGEIEYEPGDIECGLLEVPENREDPDSRFIELHFVKLNSRWGKDEEEDDEEEDSGLAPGKRDDPVIYLTGGPGARVNYYVGRFKDHTLLDHRDLYILEQRGIGFRTISVRFTLAENLRRMTYPLLLKAWQPPMPEKPTAPQTPAPPALT